MHSAGSATCARGAGHSRRSVAQLPLLDRGRLVQALPVRFSRLQENQRLRQAEACATRD